MHARFSGTLLTEPHCSVCYVEAVSARTERAPMARKHIPLHGKLSSTELNRFRYLVRNRFSTAISIPHRNQRDLLQSRKMIVLVGFAVRWRNLLHTGSRWRQRAEILRVHFVKGR